MQDISLGELRVARIPNHARAGLRVLLIAKHVFWGGGLHLQDGNHALYHREMREVLERLGIDLRLADSYEALFTHPAATSYSRC